jgi:subtilisin family serine protease
VKEAWAQGFTGQGIVVSILDDGIEKNHPDLAGNYVRRSGREVGGGAAIPAEGCLGAPGSLAPGAGFFPGS